MDTEEHQAGSVLFYERVEQEYLVFVLSGEIESEDPLFNYESQKKIFGDKHILGDTKYTFNSNIICKTNVMIAKISFEKIRGLFDQKLDQLFNKNKQSHEVSKNF